VLLVFVFLLLVTPLLIAEFTGIGRAISPWKAKLVLCARRTAHQDGLVGNSGEFRRPELFSGLSDKDGFFWLLFLAVEKK